MPICQIVKRFELPKALYKFPLLLLILHMDTKLNSVIIITAKLNSVIIMVILTCALDLDWQEDSLHVRHQWRQLGRFRQTSDKQSAPPRHPQQ